MSRKEQEKITQLEQRIIELGDADTSLQRFLVEEREKFTAEVQELQSKLDESLEDGIQKQHQLDEKELKRLARAYDKQETHYKDDVTFWGKWLFWVATSFIVSTLTATIISHGLPWVSRIEYYAIDIVLFSVLWFCSSQYSESLRFKNDYANRKTLAQSFSNIFNSLPEDDKIKDKFIEKTTDVLCAPALKSDKEPVLSKEALKQFIEISKMVTEKTTTQ